MSELPGPSDDRKWAGFTVERFKAFADAVVAIALTLLILPLMESVSDAASEKLSSLEFLKDHLGQLGSFTLSFILIANFWRKHHRLYDHVEYISHRLMTINLAWLLTIVWLPIPTAMVGQMPADSLQAVLYVGTLIASAALLLSMEVHLSHNQQLYSAPLSQLRRAMSTDIAMIICFTFVLIVAVIWPGTGYFAFFSAFLISPLQERIFRGLERRAARKTA